MNVDTTGTGWVQRYLDAWNSHDGGQVAAFMAEGVTYEDLAGGTTYRGRDEVASYVAATHEWSGDYRFVIVTTQSSGRSYAIEWEMLGTNTGELGGIAPTGKPYRIRGVSVGQLNDAGEIASNRDYFNFADYLAQVGLFTYPA
ncbi:MAG: nuclear transport factor 2 family protein [Actinomycetota bacterium]|nr:nuclear transport factor 2 family protein [Actinomycetota bacterium]